jgi:integrase
VWFQRKKLSTGDIVRYGYWGRGVGSVALGREGSEQFFINLAKVVAREPPDRTVNYLLWAYRTKVLPQLRERTQADYRKRLDLIETRFGSLSLKAMSSDLVARHIIEWRDTATESSRQRDYLIQVLSLLLNWGVRERLLEKNQAALIDRQYSGDRRDKIWSTKQQEAFLVAAPDEVRWAFVLAVETGQRQGDLMKLPWSSVKDTIIELRQSKGEVPVAIPISPELKACLRTIPRRATTVLTSSHRRPWGEGANGFRSAWGKAVRRAGVSGVSFHDLRGTFATRRLAAGWSLEEVAYCTGHSLRDLRSLERYVNREVVAAERAHAIARRLGST